MQLTKQLPLATTSLRPEPEWVTLRRADDIPCNDINFEMSSGSLLDYMEAMMGPTFLGRVGPSERDGVRIDPESGCMFLRTNGVELQLTTID